MKNRPQSAITKPENNYKFDDTLLQQDFVRHSIDPFDHSNITFSKFLIKRPWSGFSDQTIQNQPIKILKKEQKQYSGFETRGNHTQQYSDIKQNLNQAGYCLTMNQIDNSIELFTASLSRASQMIPSYQFVHLFEEVFQTLNTKAVIHLNEGDLDSANQIIQILLKWSQLQILEQKPVEFISLIRCPIRQQITILNTYSLHLIKIGKLNECQEQLEKALSILSNSKIEETLQPLIGQTYLNYSTSLLYQQNFLQGMKVATTALTHLQQTFLDQRSNQNNELIAELISDAYINIAICKEKQRLFQEAHFHYYSSLVNAQKHLSQQVQELINSIYDKFLQRQVGYLQQTTKLVQKPTRLPKQLNLNSLRTNTQQISSSKLRIDFKQKRVLKNQQQNDSQTFQEKSKASLKPKQFILDQTMNLQRTQQIHNKKIKYTKIVKNIPFKIRNMKNSNSNQTHNKQQQNQRFDIASSILSYLENIINDIQLIQSNDVILLEDYQDIHIQQTQQKSQKALNSPQNSQDDLAGQMLIYLFRAKNILYFRFNSYQQNLKSQYDLEIGDQFKKGSLFGHSFNVSDVANEIYLNSYQDTDKKYAQFLRGFILEVCRNLNINQDQQALQVSTSLNQIQEEQKQICFFLSEMQDYISIQQKNDQESLVFVTQDPQKQDITEDGMQIKQKKEIQPLVFNKVSREQGKDIMPLITANEYDYPQKEEYDDDEIQPLIAKADFLIGHEQQNRIQNKNHIVQYQNLEVIKGNQKNIIARGRKQNKVDYDEAFDIIEEGESQEKTQSMNIPFNIHSNANDLEFYDRVRNIHDDKFQKQKQQICIFPGRNQQERFLIKIASEDQVQNEVIEVYADKKAGQVIDKKEQ